MNILVIGAPGQASECRKKFGEAHTWHEYRTVTEAVHAITQVDVVFDFVSPDDPLQLKQYHPGFAEMLFIDTSYTSLSTVASYASIDQKRLFGFCGLPSLLDRELLEVCLLKSSDPSLLKSICAQLNTSYEIVGDHAGMVSPRVICMIINEAFFTLEEGTATRDDIDMAMKLGTNYPYGPFEWAQRIGLTSVVKVLRGAHAETGDDRYRICPLLLLESGAS